MDTSVVTPDAKSREELTRDNERLNALLEQWRREQEKQMNDARLARLREQQEREEAEATRQTNEVKKLNEIRLGRPEHIDEYRALPSPLKVKLISAYGADFPAELNAKSKTGLSWADWDKLRDGEVATKSQPNRKVAFYSTLQSVWMRVARRSHRRGSLYVADRRSSATSSRVEAPVMGNGTATATAARVPEHCSLPPVQPLPCAYYANAPA